MLFLSEVNALCHTCCYTVWEMISFVMLMNVWAMIWMYLELLHFESCIDKLVAVFGGVEISTKTNMTTACIDYSCPLIVDRNMIQINSRWLVNCGADETYCIYLYFQLLLLDQKQQNTFISLFLTHISAVAWVLVYWVSCSTPVWSLCNALKESLPLCTWTREAQRSVLHRK